MASRLFAKSGLLGRIILRRDRIRISIWLFSIIGITLIVADAFEKLYANETEREAIAETMRNPAMSAMVGQGYGLENYTIGAMMSHQMLLFTCIAVAIMNVLLVGRMRADEEDGNIEIIRSLPTGRLANIHATTLVMGGVNLSLALVTAFGLYALPIDSLDLQGSLLYGAALGGSGIFFMAVTALATQLSESSRGVITLAFTLLGISYIIRAIGDSGEETISWFSPLGWILGAEVYVNNYWWPITLTVIVSLILLAFAYYLNAIRDLDSSFLHSKPGKAYASQFLGHPFGLSVRLQRTAIISWGIGLYILGASYGSVLGDLESFFTDNEMLQAMLAKKEGYSLMEQFIPMLMSAMAMIATVPPLMIIFKLRGEEKKHRTEIVLVQGVSRYQLLSSYIVLSLLLGFAALSITAIGLWSAGTVVVGGGLSFSTIYESSIAFFPAMFLMIGLVILLVGTAPKWTGLGWLYLGYSFFVVYLGDLLDFPTWMGNLSPFGHIAQLPIEEMEWMKAVFLIIIAIILLIIGMAGYRRRDIEG